MSQSAFSIPNQAGAGFRSDVNAALQALATISSGSTAPATTYAFQLWMDTSTSPATLRQRNSANNAWLAIGSADTAAWGFAALATAQTFTAAQRGNVSALTDGATITPDFAVANNFSVTLGGNRTLANPSNQTAGQSGVIFITQDGTGSRTLSYGSNWKFPNATAPVLTTTASAVDVLVYAVQSASRINAQLLTNLG
jgi:hypothetical protein